MTPEERRSAQKMLAAGASPADVARQFGTTARTIQRLAAKARAEAQRAGVVSAPETDDPLGEVRANLLAAGRAATRRLRALLEDPEVSIDPSRLGVLCGILADKLARFTPKPAGDDGPVELVIINDEKPRAKQRRDFEED